MATTKSDRSRRHRDRLAQVQPRDVFLRLSLEGGYH